MSEAKPGLMAGAIVQRQPSSSLSPHISSDLDSSRSTSLRHSPSEPLEFPNPLFDTPSDLVCPITCELLIDPVINGAGQVYERAAIERHLARSEAEGTEPRDPISNSPLSSTNLLPVYPMRSRAAEYREKTARACVDAAALPSCAHPVRYLRRAAELLAPLAGSNPPGSTSPPQTQPQPQSLIPGITREFACFLHTHQGGAYDALALKYFGNELLRAGACDAAADVFYRLLLEADDRQQQSEYLQLCLDCWSSSSSKHATCQPQVQAPSPGPASTPSSSSGSSHQADQAASVEVDDEVINKLAAFVERQECLSMGSIIDMLATARVGQTAGLRLCNTLLGRAVAGQGPLGSSITGFSKAVELLMRCIQLNQQQGAWQVQLLADQVQSLAAAVAPAAAAAAGERPETAAAAADAEAGVGGASGPAGSSSRRQQGSSSKDDRVAGSRGGISAKQPGSRGGRQQHKGKSWQAIGSVFRSKAARRIATGVLAAASLVGSQQLAWRVARVAPLLLLLDSRY